MLPLCFATELRATTLSRSRFSFPTCAILRLYDELYQLKPSPVVALNRAIALGKARGPDDGLAELERIPDTDRLKDYPFYPAAQGEFHLLAGRLSEAQRYFEKAVKLARNASEARFLARKRDACLR